MNINEAVPVTFYDEIKMLIESGKHTLAEEKLNTVSEKTSEWHFLYSSLLLKKTWFDSAKKHLELAASMSPDNVLYQNALAALMSRYNRYSDDYYGRPYRRRSDCCCCCCDDCCCHFSCCDLICMDSCCECMGGDLIDCI